MAASARRSRSESEMAGGDHVFEPGRVPVGLQRALGLAHGQGTRQFCPVTSGSDRVGCAGGASLPIRWTALTIHCDDLPAVVVPRMGLNRANFRSNEWEVIAMDGKSPLMDGKCRCRRVARPGGDRRVQGGAGGRPRQGLEQNQKWPVATTYLSQAAYQLVSSARWAWRKVRNRWHTSSFRM